MENFSRITLNPAVMGGKPCIRGMRVTVSMVIGLIASGYPLVPKLRLGMPSTTLCVVLYLWYNTTIRLSPSFVVLILQTQEFLMIYDNTNLTQASVNLAKLCDQVVNDRDVVIINRPDSENVALIAADELESLMETAHLLSSPKNAIRLLTALQESNQKTLKPQSVSELHQALLG